MDDVRVVYHRGYDPEEVIETPFQILLPDGVPRHVTSVRCEVTGGEFGTDTTVILSVPENY